MKSVSDKLYLRFVNAIMDIERSMSKKEILLYLIPHEIISPIYNKVSSIDDSFYTQNNEDHEK